MLRGDYRIRRRLFVIGLVRIERDNERDGQRRSCRGGWGIRMRHNRKADGRRGQGPYQAGLSSAD